jgi:hypothetical protein
MMMISQRSNECVFYCVRCLDPLNGSQVLTVKRISRIWLFVVVDVVVIAAVIHVILLLLFGFILINK